MQQDSIEALHQNRNHLVQEAGLSSLAVFSEILLARSSRRWRADACVKNAQGLYRNWLKDVTSNEVDVHIIIRPIIIIILLPFSTYQFLLLCGEYDEYSPTSCRLLQLYNSVLLLLQ